MDDVPTPPTRRKRKELPDFGWPAAMKRATAAAYLDMSEGAFLREITAGTLPGSFILGGRDHWRKDAIDAAIARLESHGLDDPTERLRERLRAEKAQR